MKMQSIASAISLSAALLTVGTAQAQVITPTGVFGAQPTLTFGGDGIPTDAVMVSAGGALNTNGSKTGATMALTAHQRYSNPALTNNNFGTFSAMSGTDLGSPSMTDPYAMWNVGFYIGGATFRPFSYKLLFDFNPAAGTLESAHGSFDFGALTTETQDSFNLGMDFLANPAFWGGAVPTAFDPNAAGQYTFALAAYNGQGIEVDRAAIQVNAGTVVPEPSSFALMGAGLLGMMGFARRRNRNA